MPFSDEDKEIISGIYRQNHFGAGDSATGKTYLYQMSEDLKLTDEYGEIKLFNYKSDEFHQELAKCRGKLYAVAGEGL